METTKTADSIPSRLRTWGFRSWFYLGIALWILAILTFLNTISGLFVPLVVAIVLAMLFYPLVDKLVALRVNKTIGSLLVLLLIVAVLVGTLWLVWAGLANQSDEMMSRIQDGLKTLSREGKLAVSADLVDRIRQALPQLASGITSGITSFFASSFSGVVSMAMGGYTALFLLYYLLSDWHNIANWFGSHLGVPADLGVTLVADTVSAVRMYFYALTMANLPVAAVVGITMVLLGLPLAMPVAVVTMVTSYIPYLGALISTVFAALVALGAGGISDAIIIIVVIIVLQNVLDPIITNFVASDKLEMHPIVTLLTTLGGGILFGALGAMLASPVIAALIEARKAIGVYSAKQEDESK